MANFKSNTGGSPSIVRSNKGMATERPTRRGALGLLGALAGTAAASTPIAATASAPPSPLDALWAAYQNKTREVQASRRILGAAQEQANRESPNWPKSLYHKRQRVNANGETEVVEEPLDRDDLEREIEYWQGWLDKKRIGRAELKLRLLDHWERKVEAANARHRVPELDAVTSALEDELYALRDRIHETPAVTAHDAMIKLSAAHDRWCCDKAGENYGFEVEPKYILRIIDDLLGATEKAAA